MKSLIFILAAALALTAHAEEAKPAESEITLTTITLNDEGERLLADTRGNTLYVFDIDQGKLTSACNAACAEVWPPYLLTDVEVSAVKSPLGVIVRENKKSQMTYEGRPVYAYALDRGAAADAGDGIGGVWHSIEVEK